MEFIDSHCHIQSIGDDIIDHSAKLWSKSHLSVDEVIKNAREVNVSTLIIVGCNLRDSKRAQQLAQQYSGLYATIGIHPHEAQDFLKTSNAKEVFEKLLSLDKVVAIGECGLDYFYNYSDHRSQLEVLKFQIEMALKYNLPLIFHVREAFRDFWPILEAYKQNFRAVLHSFGDNLENLTVALGKNFMIGVNGISTFVKEESRKEIFKQIPLDNLMFETDSPYLTPIPFRGSINEPKYIPIIANYLADLRGEDLTEIALKSTNNTKRLFGL